MASLHANLFTIGIGKNHNKLTLNKLIKSENKNFKGTYIDTSVGEHTIESAISKIYAQTMASFHHLELSSPQLPAGAWSIDSSPSLAKDGQLVCNLGSLSEQQSLSKTITIHPHKLKSPLDLSKVTFILTFIDPNGQPGEVLLPWNPNNIIDPKIAKSRI